MATSSTCSSFLASRRTGMDLELSRSSMVFSRFNNFGGRCSCQAFAALRTGTGFGKRPETKPKPKILKELDVGKVEKTETYRIFARKVAGEEVLSKWEKIGEILIEAGASVEIALKERRNALVAGVKHQHPLLVILQKGEAVQYGVELLPPKDVKAKEEQSESSKANESSSEGDVKEGEDEGQSQEAKPADEDASIVALNLDGKQPEETVAAILRVDDGKPPGRTRKF